MKAVLLTDVFQSVLMYSAVLAVVVSGLIYSGGIENLFQVAKEGNRIEFDKWEKFLNIQHKIVIFDVFTVSKSIQQFDILGSQLQ